ncbi:MAG: 4-(cytidine 5'-diphospho)-2-C-methyl-D-erythritol kinase, partial [Candidatus Rokubacteria bacterium]|nr:4-(cytidine 5'-diphospho)-2-C-methyl-D-erythritol kinase [Candidatus Rokubacteria bacterium]
MLERGRRLTVRARAKVNLGLEVLGRRADGYHALLTFLSPVDLADRVMIETTEGSGPGGGDIAVQCSAPGVPPGADNLVWRAADLLRREAGVAAGVRIRLVKAIPVAAGLGGGSADAAAVLLGLGRLWRLALPAGRWRALGAALGMDVPFFLGEGPALGAGRGDELAAVSGHRPIPLVLVNPGFPLPTREVYGRLEPADFTDGSAVRALVTALPAGPGAIAARLVNGLERPAARLWPGLAEVKAALVEAGALGAVMSGSGPTVVGVAASGAEARRIRAALAGRPWRCWVTRSVGGPALSIIPDGDEATRGVLGRGQAVRRGTLD